MGKAVICMGDSTSHGGKVLEGLPHAAIHGKPIAARGHKVFCPLCKGIFPIVEGVPFHTFAGIDTAVEGMRTACGATLIASQHDMTIDCGGGASPSEGAATVAERTQREDDETMAELFDQHFQIVEGDGEMRARMLAVIALGCMSTMTWAAKPKVLGTCRLGAEAKQLVTVTAKDPVYGRDTIYLRLGPDAPERPLFAEDDIEESRGQAVKVHCAGDSENVLVITGNIGSSNYLKGLLVRYHDGRFQRLHFAEHDFPSRVYLDGADTLLFIPERFTDTKPWIVYRYDGTTGEEEATSADALPAGRRYVEIKLR